VSVVCRRNCNERRSVRIGETSDWQIPDDNTEFQTYRSIPTACTSRSCGRDRKLGRGCGLIVQEGDDRRIGRDLRVAEVVGQGLQRVGTEVVLIPEDMVMRGAARSLPII
jgi:hypothetical protein